MPTGRIIGTNLCTLNLLPGTGYMPSLDGVVLMLEDDELSDPAIFAGHLTSVPQLPDANDVQGLVIGRFQQSRGMTRGLLTQIVGNQPALTDLPVLANADFGDTHPMAILPTGGQATRGGRHQQSDPYPALIRGYIHR